MTFETDEGPDLIPADAGLSAADNNLTNLPPEERLKSFINELIVPEYDVLILDLPGKNDNITLNGLFAVENVVPPLKPGAFEWDRLVSLEADLHELREEFGAGENVDVPFCDSIGSTSDIVNDGTDLRFRHLTGTTLTEN